MKVLVIGDIHGRYIWKEIVTKEGGVHAVDKIVFIGDYFDSPVVSPRKIASNFEIIVNFATRNSRKVCLLVGNHDFHYLYPDFPKSSGYDAKNATIAKILLEKAKRSRVLMAATNFDGVLYTHAGVSNSWMYIASRLLKKEEQEQGIPYCVNAVLDKHPELFAFWKFDDSGHGEHPCQSPMWIRPKSLMGEMPAGWKQVVGHTVMKEGIQNIADTLALVDALSVKQYLVVDDGKFIIKKL